MGTPRELDEYRLVRPLGQGAMGQVYLAQDTLLDRLVAIKLLNVARPDASRRARFLTEARAIARLQHPNVVTIHRAGEVAGCPFLVSEYVPGVPLDRLPRPVPAAELLRLAVGLARGLSAAHRQGVLHRDIKPSNAILSEAGEVKLLDFGLAKLLDAASTRGPAASRPAPPGGAAEALSAGVVDQTLSFDGEEAGPTDVPAGVGVGVGVTRAGGVLGTPRYMAPEIWRGEPATPRSDVYSVGVLLYELGCGRPPHEAETLEALGRRVMEGGAAPLRAEAPALPAALCEIVDRCLRLDPAERPAGGEALRQLLEDLAAERAGGGPAALAGSNPYRGLEAFGLAQRDQFFGRGPDVRAVLERLRSAGLVFVTGDSGVGKSSLCGAGVAPAVLDGALGDGRRYELQAMVPGGRPLSALAARLAAALAVSEPEASALLQEGPHAVLRALRRRLGAGGGLLLLLDQAEELVTLADAAEAEALSRLLGVVGADGPEGVRVLVSLRGDFLVRAAALPGLGDALGQGLYFLRPLDAAGLRAAIVGPARLAGLTFESDALVEELVESTLSAAGGLPLLQFTLAQLWERRDAERQVVPLSAMRQLGGVAGALSRHADGVLAALLPAGRAAARRLLCQLVTAEGTRARRQEAELLGPDPAERAALAALVRGRLLHASSDEQGAVYEIAHEALVQGWGTLGDWLDADADLRRLRERLQAAAAEWERLGRPQEGLFGPKQIAEAERVGLAQAALPAGAAAFLAASQARARRQRRARFGVALGAPALLCLAALGALEWRRSAARARQQEEQALREMGKLAKELAAQPGREDEALAAGVQAVAPALLAGLEPLGEALGGLRAAVARGRRALPLVGHQAPVSAMGLSPDGTLVATAAGAGPVLLWETGTGRRVLAVPGYPPYVASVQLSPRGGELLTVEMGDRARLIDRTTGRARIELRSGLRHMVGGSYSPDGARVLLLGGGSGSAVPDAEIWDAAAGQRLLSLRGHQQSLTDGSFSPDGSQVATAAADGTARLWDARTGQPLAVLPGAGVVFPLRYAPDGARVATAAQDGRIRILETRTGRLVAVCAGHSGEIGALGWSSDGARLVSGGRDGTARIWDAASGRLLQLLPGHQDEIVAAAFFPDGDRVLTASRDRTARVFSARTGETLSVLGGHAEAITGALISSDGRRVVTGAANGQVRLFSGLAGARLSVLRGHGGVINDVRFSPDGRLLASGADDGAVRLWDAKSGRPLLALSGHRGSVHRLAFARDGRTVFSAGADGTVRRWDTRDGRALGVLAGHEGTVSVVLPLADGQHLVSAGFDGTLRVWRLDAVEAPRVITTGAGRVTAAGLSPDGRRVIALGDDAAGVWEVPSGRLVEMLPTGHNRGTWVSVASFHQDGTAALTSRRGEPARLWDLASRQARRVFDGSGGEIWAAALAPDGKVVFIGGNDGRGSGFGQLLDLATGARRASFPGHRVTISAAAFSPDGSRLVTVAYDRLGRLWDARSGQLLAQLEGHSQEPEAVAYSPDGARIATAGNDRTVRLWDGRTGAPLGAAEADDLLVPEGVELSPADAGRSPLESLRLACELLRHLTAPEAARDACRRLPPRAG